ncbi:sugar phosphate isomerase/epimerase family protein [Streptococcus moroccensis]|uniref:Sugar phosphate isomerase/epimerase n=1 Tax=Streptococcus moroccensis TaxID=1451356 RepID=A0ABT9YRH7_9STRE|nr:sugar phosphate isomerase/epimerase [Streptococcus moroccensis]MDQ0222601.1 sugar phosphate isomerase/epimerase [Streptococcus moroccensis]
MVKIGFLTNRLVQLGESNLESIANWAMANGFRDLEVGPTIPMEEELFADVIHKTGISISALTYCRNYLSSISEEADMHRKELIKRINFAGDNNVEKIVTSTGILKPIREDIYDSYESIRKLPSRSFDDVVKFFEPIVELAENKKVKIAVENCPLMGNIAISPVMWRALLEKLDSEYFGLTYDPSHLVWEFINPYDYISEFGNKIFHIHAKDTIVDHKRLSETGILTNFDWWEYALPGTGDLDWDRFFKELQKVNYKGTISIEHEDKEHSNSLDEVKNGLIFGQKFIQEKLNLYNMGEK